MKRTKEDWLLLINDQLQSGLTIAVYCRVSSISISGFYNARSRFGFTGRNNDYLNDQTDDSRTASDVESAEKDTIDHPDECPKAPIQNLAVKKTSQKPGFSKVFIEDDLRPKSKPASTPPDDPLDFYCNGIRLTMPGGISDRKLFRVMEVCTRL